MESDDQTERIERSPEVSFTKEQIDRCFIAEHKRTGAIFTPIYSPIIVHATRQGSMAEWALIATAKKNEELEIGYLLARREAGEDGKLYISSKLVSGEHLADTNPEPRSGLLQLLLDQQPKSIPPKEHASVVRRFIREIFNPTVD